MTTLTELIEELEATDEAPRRGLRTRAALALRAMADTRLWSVTNGFHGYGPVACLVEASSSDEAIEKASARFAAAADEGISGGPIASQAHEWADPTEMTATPVQLPYVGDTLPGGPVR